MEESDNRYLSGQQAAEFLGVKPATIYAYASRGMIESLPGETARERRYKLSDLIRVRQSSRGFKLGKREEPAVWTGPVIKSSITEIQSNYHCYRGHNAVDLAASGTAFESVAELIWETGTDSSAWSDVEPLGAPKPVRSLARNEVDYLDIFKLLLVTAEMTDLVPRKLTREDRFEVGRGIIATMSMAPGLADGKFEYISDSKFPVANSLLNALSQDVSKEKVRVVNCALVLCADHELNASALAARIAASCDASIYSCMLSALGSFSGSLHGSASRRAEDIVSNSFKFKTARAWLKDYLSRAERIPGFGTDLYSKGDPRARSLLKVSQQVARKDRNLTRLLEIVECVREHLGDEPNLDIGLAAVTYALELPPGSGSILFAVSRTTGWIAHAIEQREYGGPIRPRARYIGRSVGQ